MCLAGCVVLALLAARPVSSGAPVYTVFCVDPGWSTSNSYGPTLGVWVEAVPSTALLGWAGVGGAVGGCLTVPIQVLAVGQSFYWEWP